MTKFDVPCGTLAHDVEFLIISPYFFPFFVFFFLSCQLIFFGTLRCILDFGTIWNNCLMPDSDIWR